MEGNKKTILTLEQNGVKMTWEGSWDADLDQIMYGFIGCLRGITFGDWVISHIKDWCEEQLPEGWEEDEDNPRWVKVDKEDIQDEVLRMPED